MNAPAAFLAIRWLVWDTFRQAQASAIFWAMLAVSLLCIVFCATTSFETNLDPETLRRGEPIEDIDEVEAKRRLPGDLERIRGKFHFLGGAYSVPYNEPPGRAVRVLEMVFVVGVADTAGLWLALIWTAAFLPAFLEPGAAAVLLAKPAPRWSLLAGKFVGVLVLVLFQVAVFVLGTWLALGCATGVWDSRYLLAIPMLLLHFTMFFSFSVMLAVWTRSTIVCIFGSLLFWFLCWGMNYGRHAHLVLFANEAEAGQGLTAALELGYWVLPKPADMGFLLSQALRAEEFFPASAELTKAGIDPTLSILSSLAFSAVILAIACYEFLQADY